mmetsp:Transcript_37517/g.93254  ORF Transcript_37517/g.93254 Transcript_37517/m.93254 type:complete len:250 (+) Transcript_37517:1131-1880(+)
MIPRHAAVKRPHASSEVTAARTATSASAPGAAAAAPILATVRVMMPRARICDASHRLNGSASLARTKRRWSVEKTGDISSLTGAENPRRTEGTGSAAIPWNVNVAFIALSRSTTVPAFSPDTAAEPVPPSSPDTSTSVPTMARSFPSGPMRPTATGMSCASLVASLSGVLGSTCSSVSENVCAAASYMRVHFTVGVPACEYQSLRRDMSFPPLASVMAAKKSSVVTAWPSWRSKYKSIPFRNPALPSRV